MNAIQILSRHIALHGQWDLMGNHIRTSTNDGLPVKLVVSRERKLLIHAANQVFPQPLSEAESLTWITQLKVQP
jgi:hypothetical protein